MRSGEHATHMVRALPVTWRIEGRRQRPVGHLARWNAQDHSRERLWACVRMLRSRLGSEQGSRGWDDASAQGRCPRAARMSRSQVRLAGVLALLLLGAASGVGAGAGAGLELLPLVKELRPQETNVAGVAVFELDESILAATDGGYANLRVFDDRGNEVPCLVRSRRAAGRTVVERDVRAIPVSFKVLDENRAEIVVRRPDGVEGVEALRLVSSQKDFEKEVTVSGQRGDGAWRVLAEPCPIFDYSRFVNLRRLRIDVGSNDAALYKLVLSNISERHRQPLERMVRETQGGSLVAEFAHSEFRRENFKIDSVQLVTREVLIEKGKLAYRPYTVRDLVLVRDGEEKETVVSFEVAGVPLTALWIETERMNFSRLVTLEGRRARVRPGRDMVVGGASPDMWCPVVSGTLRRIDLGAVREEDVTLRWGNPSRYREYRLCIRDFDSPPFEGVTVTVEGLVQEALFFQEPGRGYRVFYGGTLADAPTYDIGDVLARAKAVDAVPCTLGDELANPDYRAPRRWGALPYGRLFLLLAMGLAVAALVVVIAWGSRKLA